MKSVVKRVCTLIEVLEEMSPSSSKTTLRSWLKEGRVLVDGVSVKLANSTVEPGQEISLEKAKKIIYPNITVLYEDPHFIVIDKPQGLLSVATDFEKSACAHAYLKKIFKPRRVFVVHRLDQETSGVMVFALSEKAYHGFKNLFLHHALDRCYTAIVEGSPKQKSGTWVSFLFEDQNYYVSSVSNPSIGERAETHFRVLKEGKKYSSLELKLETGKKNQIRVHCYDAGCPIAGDEKYGAKTNPIKRLCLHAHLLAFDHPVTEKPMRFVSEVPKSFFSLVA